jgi:membrane protease YdiL (CAAX protease family)
LLWLLTLFGRKATVPWRVWIAVIVAALIFGVGHLPAARAMMVMSPPMVVRILVLNLIPGIVFGFLFWKRGLLSAMTAHFSADVLMHAALPLLLPSLAGG